MTTSTLNVAQSQLYYYDDPVYYHSTEWEGTITNDEYGNTVIDFGPYNSHLDNQAIKVSYCNQYGNIINSKLTYDMFDSYRLTLCKTNGVGSDDTNTLNNVPSYPVSVLMPGNKGLKKNELGILNFFNFGLGWENFENDEGYVWGEYDILKGYVEGDKFVIPQQMFRSQVSGSYTNGVDPTYTNYYTFGYDPVTHERKSDITGTIKQGIPTHYGANYWVHTVNGGTLHTYLGGNIKLDPWGSTDKSTDTNPPHWTSYEASVKNTVIKYFDFNQEITFDCDLTVTPRETFAANGKDYIRCDFALTEKDNFCSDYTTHYDVYYLEGAYNHAANVPVDRAKKIQTVVFDDNKTTYTFSYDLPYPEGYDPNNKEERKTYTFFVVANYNAAEISDAQTKAATNGSAPGLAPTYHALTSFTELLPTALNGLATAEANVKVVSGAVVVENFDGVVEVYNAQGACVYTGTDSRIELNGGVYIVRAGTKAVKVVIG